MSNTTKNQKVYFENFVAVNNENNSDRVLFVKDMASDKIYIQKIIPLYQKEIYEYLMTNNISNVPKVYSLIYEKDFLVALCEYINGDTLTNYINNIFLQQENLKQENLKNANRNNSISISNIKNFYKHIYTLLDIVENLQKSKTIIHRDIKPDNIIITKDGELYLIDFDSAKVYEEDKTSDTHLIVSHGYAAPEQYGFGVSNKSTDIYAIGKVIDDYVSIINDDELSKKISPIIEKCCKIDYKDRYKNVNQIRADLFRAEHNFMFLAIPGYRTNNFVHILIATFTYLLLFYICFINTYSTLLSLNICVFLSAISFIFIFFNYLDVHRFLPFTKSKNVVVKYLSILFFSIIIPAIIINCFIIFYK